MIIERTKNSVHSAAAGMLNRCINVFVPFVIRTVLIQKLGTEYLGLNSLFTSIIQVLNLTELGVGSALVFNMYKPVAEDDYASLSSLLQVYKTVYRRIGVVIFALGLCLLPALPVLVDLQQLEGTGIDPYILFLIYLVNTVISYWFFSYRKSLLMAYQRQDVISNINSVVQFVLYAAQILVLWLIPNYYLYIILMPIFTLADNLCIAFVTRKRYAAILDCKSESKQESKNVLSSAKYVVGHKIGAVIIQSGDSIVISAFLNLTVLTIYSNYFYIISALVGFIHVGYNAVLAGVGNSIVTQAREKTYQLFREMKYLLFYVVAFCSICLLALYQPFMELWMGEDLMFPMQTVILFVVYFYTWQVRVLNLNFKDAAGMWKHDFLKPYVGMAVNVLLNILLVQFWGVDGVLCATIVVMVCIYYPWEMVVLYKHLFQTGMGKDILRDVYYAALTAVCAAVTYWLVGLIPLSGIAGLLCKGAVTLVASNVLLISFTARQTEAKRVFERVKRICRRKN